MSFATGTATAPCMQFRLSEDEEAIVEVAAGLFSELSTDEDVVRSEHAGEAYDERLWGQLVESGLIEAILPEAAGGADLGMTGLALILREQGQRLARVPLATTGVAALAISTFDGPAAVLDQIVAGSARLAALQPEPQSRIDGSSVGDGFVLDGTIEMAYLAASATHFIVTFTADGVDRVAIIAADAPGVAIENWEGMSKQIHAAVTLTGVTVGAPDLVGSDARAAAWLRYHLLVATAALQAGVGHEAVRRTAAYVSEREQFGRPLSTNQGVTLRAADASIDTEAIHLTVLSAAFELDQAGAAGSIEAATASLTASWWAKDAGFRIVHATQHLHGGMGADIDNHIHRFFIWAREIDILWGAAEAIREELGAVVATGRAA